ncbi:MAG: hypothetical protein IJJ33_04010 [Victivallales bacterium]|nr:hypothetical protein [Victivallales bacterium]
MAPTLQMRITRFLKNILFFQLNAKGLMSNVFADDGIPIVVECIEDENDAQNRNSVIGIGWLPYEIISYCSLSILPFFHSSVAEGSYDFWLAGSPDEKTKRRVYFCSMDSGAWSLLPWAWLFYRGTPERREFGDTLGDKMIVVHEYTGILSPFVENLEFSQRANAVSWRACLYGIASRLKVMEDAGIITEENVRIGAELHARRQRAKAAGRVP